MPRSYGQHCPLAKSLDLVGDRWTLLIVRELLDRPRRYGDLLSGLAPIATDMLAGRLRDLERNGLVVKRELPRPASANVYDLTADGRALEEVVDAFARWGRHLLTTRTPTDVVRPEWLARAVRAYVREDRTGPDLVLRLATPQGGATVRIGAGRVETVGDGDAAIAPDVVMTGEVDVLAAATDPRRVDDLVAAGRLHVAGAPEALRQLAAVFSPPRVRVEAGPAPGRVGAARA
ncbi:winged helix-turn-helix transcriptional regulator [Mycolicibacterium litorale]|uniref:Transcriptional regulator n=1 Tax=Mycolicibacterium litorale TaxID=758802 RepID=A0AAD1IN73_9MYCO|nr:helix-turn-helix domain-containing protein [Mycolicibacterium litorale]MCV7414668.1 helix-turn-helix transcriptional regulator [Mycolicibacterium litorale]TDY00836.1 HxlR family transcriptional regulator [Mycolicibacterium litorale]BBY14733.1 transcriptional regulator [Mycolicibacterium litorale]